MDTREVAEMLGTTPRVFRQFLRSPMSTYAAVGSGARYDFTDRDLPTLQKRFGEWTGAGKPKPDMPKVDRPAPARKPRPSIQDAKVWAEEGPIVLDDIRDPRVRARVLADARAAELRLELMLIAAGVHITQGHVDARTRRVS